MASDAAVECSVSLCSKGGVGLAVHSQLLGVVRAAWRVGGVFGWKDVGLACRVGGEWRGLFFFPFYCTPHQLVK